MKNGEKKMFFLAKHKQSYAKAKYFQVDNSIGLILFDFLTVNNNNSSSIDDYK